MVEVSLPNVNKPPPNLALMVIGKAMADLFWVPADKPLPEVLARIVREIEERERRDVHG